MKHVPVGYRARDEKAQPAAGLILQRYASASIPCLSQPLIRAVRRQTRRPVDSHRLALVHSDQPIYICVMDFRRCPKAFRPFCQLKCSSQCFGVPLSIRRFCFCRHLDLIARRLRSRRYGYNQLLGCRLASGDPIDPVCGGVIPCTKLVTPLAPSALTAT